MRCMACAAGDTVADTTTLSLSSKSARLSIECVPAHVCTQCGEVFFDVEVAERVDEIAEEAFTTDAADIVRRFGEPS
ncbi:MAG: hypothetical protein C0418_00540 [Coriobacteriaceae bacterium]|nr:hypothetical protein [Coriobacteriaceae bacterium]